MSGLGRGEGESDLSSMDDRERSWTSLSVWSRLINPACVKVCFGRHVIGDHRDIFVGLFLAALMFALMYYPSIYLLLSWCSTVVLA